MVNLLVGMAMSLSVLSAAVFWVHFQWTHDRQILERSHAQQETRALMDTWCTTYGGLIFTVWPSHPSTPKTLFVPLRFAARQKTSISRLNKFCSALIAMKMG